MPKIVRGFGFNFAGDAVKIHDAAPTAHIKPVRMPLFGAAGGEELPGPAPEESAGRGAQAAPAEQAQDTAYLIRPGQDAALREMTAGAVTGEIIQGAMAEAGRIMEDALLKAQQAKAEALEGLAGEAEALRRRAAEEGHREGLSAVADTVHRAAKDMEAAVARFEGERAGFEAEYEQQLKWLAAEIAGKVLARKVEEDDAVLAAMVEKAVQSLKGETWIRVEVAQEMVRLVDALTELYGGAAGVQVSPVPAQAGSIHIETPSGVMDVSLCTQLANLREYFVADAT